ncbi:MAG: ClpX C4-type zinc finger protein [Deltaproteobacteria bacterium]|nr:ClpX C4-type zinc finger protein [Deltaproteobacteria bacterium]
MSICSFCGLKFATVVTGPGVTICLECVQLCLSIMADESNLEATPRVWSSPPEPDASTIAAIVLARESVASTPTPEETWQAVGPPIEAGLRLVLTRKVEPDLTYYFFER